jgi:hypothetical protein
MSNFLIGLGHLYDRCPCAQIVYHVLHRHSPLHGGNVTIRGLCDEIDLRQASYRPPCPNVHYLPRIFVVDVLLNLNLEHLGRILALSGDPSDLDFYLLLFGPR